MDDPARRAVGLAFRRLLPVLVVMHVIAYADRVNITFAETELSQDLAISSTVFGLAAGIFFAGYVIFEIPSNLVLHRVGARVSFAGASGLTGRRGTAVLWPPLELPGRFKAVARKGAHYGLSRLVEVAWPS